ncbi:hypothetical protein [Pyrobaculum neutrophilum]|uniref:Protein translocase subunit SecE n=1 Tax=Pyrobaculum neutrophilum (strain DSM 2338 / JCM 9278 / NBRC 100436 / V24Sta) TaxID=444157 RepID=B1YAD1_PYRNV|nr:hypothetical protein [Pyrobaculum neutrophilum]ACB40580.1 conserved hypothetical protein [Pyrobaculum neutrophilum V24Sta]
MASLREKLEQILRDVRWVVSTASKPDDDEFKLVSKFLLLLAFVAGAFQLVFHLAGVYISGVVYNQPVPTLGEPAREAAAVLASIAVIVVGLIYLTAKLR